MERTVLAAIAGNDDNTNNGSYDPHAIFRSVWGPDAIVPAWATALVGTTAAATGFVLAGSLFAILSALAPAGSALASKLDSLRVFFNLNTLTASFFWVSRNGFMVTVGLLFFNLLFYGPLETFEKVTVSAGEFFSIPLKRKVVTTFLGRAVVQGMSHLVAWTILGAVASTNLVF